MAEEDNESNSTEPQANAPQDPDVQEPSGAPDRSADGVTVGATDGGLDAARALLAERNDSLIMRELELDEREAALKQREAQVEAGFPLKAAEAARALLAERNDSLIMRELELDEREAALRQREAQVEAGFPLKAAEAARALLAERNDSLIMREVELDEREAALRQREAQVEAGFPLRAAELDAEFARKRDELQEDLNAWNAEKRAKIEVDIAVLHQRRLDEALAEVSAAAKKQKDLIAAEREAWDADRKVSQAETDAQSRELAKKDGELSAKEDHLATREQELDLRENHLQELLDTVDEQVSDRVFERLASFEQLEKQVRAENDRLRDELQAQREVLDVLDDLKRRLGEDPVVVLQRLNDTIEENKRLQQERLSGPSPEIAARLSDLEKDKLDLAGELREARARLRETEANTRAVHDLRMQLQTLESDLRIVTQQNERLDAAATEATEELKRLRAAYQRPQEEAARKAEIEMPRISAETIKHPPVKPEHPQDEVAWLKGISDQCVKHGLKFPERILKAFHTALKTAEWSPITVLAGVSGTGKSELPRLYSHFGGVIFEQVSVQPNWDSQESMLGFFNSIDNKFDAQPVLRLLAQSQQKWTVDYPGVRDAVVMVLLDEMNLAHPELYFADFLSTLEYRRSFKGDDVPSLPVKMGAGLPEYELKLGRNVLWAGTMNQDETTKSLSDKVLDRSIIINFPRPTKLERRTKQNTLGESNRSPWLHRSTWDDWCVREVEFGDEIAPYLSFVEDMNDALGVVGRAVGHRVWQSVEYYMANYPDVRRAKETGNESALRASMHTAFEDQLVQKVMPKLRGIDTRGDSRTKCLDRIRTLLVSTGVNGNTFNLESDFDLAIELGYGQFMWQSANYLNQQEDGEPTAEAAHETEQPAV